MSSVSLRAPRATVLLLVADPQTRAAWVEALEASRFVTLATADVEVAIAHAREGGIDLIGFDASERPADGARLVAALERLPEPPPLLLASSSPRGPELSAHLGAAGFLPLPCDPTDLLDECEAVLASRPVALEDVPSGPASRDP